MNPKFGLLNQADPGLDKNATSHNRNQSQLNTSAFSQMYPNLPGTGSIFENFSLIESIYFINNIIWYHFNQEWFPYESGLDDAGDISE